MLINILALGTGATYGIANVLLAALAEGKSDSSNPNNLTQTNLTREYGPWHFNVNSEEASWIGILSDNSYVLSDKNLILEFILNKYIKFIVYMFQLPSA